MIKIKEFAIFFKSEIKMTQIEELLLSTNQNVIEIIFPGGTYWTIKSRNKAQSIVTLRNVQYPQKIIKLTFNQFGFLVSNFDLEDIFLMKEEDVPKVIHI